MKVADSRSFAELVGFGPAQGQASETHGTTVLALRFDKGVLMLADRRATMGNLIMYEHAEKILPLDNRTVVAVSGAYARSLEVSRYLRHAFKYYERLNLVEISAEGKLMEISKALQGNLPAAAEGNGIFLPIAGAYDAKSEKFGVYFFDVAGARFQSSDYACAGSGSERIRGIFEYLIRTKGPWATRKLDAVMDEALTMLDIAADLDSATGGFRKILPSACVLTKDGCETYTDDQLRESVERVLNK